MLVVFPLFKGSNENLQKLCGTQHENQLKY